MLSLIIHFYYRHFIDIQQFIYPTRLFWQRQRNQVFFIGITWLCAFLFSIGFIFTGDIIYNVENQICQIPLKLSISVIFTAFYIYIIPIVLTLYLLDIISLYS
jgi:hypothetical protein